MDSVLFKHNVPLNIWTPDHVIDVQLSRKFYTSRQTVTAKIAVHKTDLQEYHGPIQVSLYSPHGYVVYSRRLQIRGSSVMNKAKQLNMKVLENVSSFGAEFTYTLDAHTMYGEWLMMVSTEIQQTNKTFSVVDYKPSNVDVLVALPPAVSLSDSTLAGYVTANYTLNGFPVCGNLTLTALVMNMEREVLYKQVTFFLSVQNLIKPLCFTIQDFLF